MSLILHIINNKLFMLSISNNKSLWQGIIFDIILNKHLRWDLFLISLLIKIYGGPLFSLINIYAGLYFFFNKYLQWSIFLFDIIFNKNLRWSLFFYLISFLISNIILNKNLQQTLFLFDIIINKNLWWGTIFYLTSIIL